MNRQKKVGNDMLQLQMADFAKLYLSLLYHPLSEITCNNETRFFAKSCLPFEQLKKRKMGGKN